MKHYRKLMLIPLMGFLAYYVPADFCDGAEIPLAYNDYTLNEEDFNSVLRIGMNICYGNLHRNGRTKADPNNSPLQPYPWMR